MYIQEKSMSRFSDIQTDHSTKIENEKSVLNSTVKVKGLIVHNKRRIYQLFCEFSTERNLPIGVT
jgi:hypothetical protein